MSAARSLRHARRALPCAALLLLAASCRTPAPSAPAPSSTVTLQLLAINDFHGQLAPPASPFTLGPDAHGAPERVDAGGVAWLARHIAQLRAQNPNTLVVSAGDLVGASPLASALFHDEPSIEAMNALGLDLAGVGNHEFDEGRAELLRLQRGGCHPKDGCQDGTPFPGARFHFLAANVVDTATGRTLFPPYEVRSVEGVKVAFIGMTLEGTPTIVTPSGVAGLRFLDEVETVNRLVPQLEAQGVQAIVVLLHEGGEQAPGSRYDGCTGLTGPIVDIARGLSPAVDVVISAHTHQAYDCVLSGKRVTSAASMGRLVTALQLTLDRASGEVLRVQSRQVVVTRDVPPVPEQAALVARYQALAAPLERKPVGSLRTALTDAPGMQGPPAESVLGDVIADAQLEASRAQGAQVAFMNPGGIRANLDAGEVTYGEVFSVHPFGNTLVTLTLTGRQLDELLEQQWLGARPRILSPSRGFTYAWSAAAAPGSKVDPASLRLAGAPVLPDREYRVTVNSFLAAGGDDFRVLPQGTQRVGGIADVDALEAYLRAHSPLAPPATDRVRALP